MLGIVFLALMSASMLPAQALKHLNSTIMSEQIIYHRNDYLSLEISGEGEDSIIYMNVDQPIDVGDDILMKMRLKHDGETLVMPPLSDVNLCTLLWNEANEPDGMEAMYMTSRAFNLDGYQCPIKKTVMRLTPWVLIKQHVFESDLPCGRYTYELMLDQCRAYASCKPLIVAELDVIMTAHDC